MSAEKPPSIMCGRCGGWHPTEAHAQYEGEAREKRMAEIKARPDSAYRFDTLGFKPEKADREEGEIEPWMHEVIEKAKELGDDLQDSDFFIHAGPLNQHKRLGFNSKTVPSVLSFVTQERFPNPNPSIKHREEFLYVSPHDAGREIETWAVRYTTERVGSKNFKELLVLQERWVQSRTAEDLDVYRKKIKQLLSQFIERFTTDYYQEGMRQHTLEAQELLNQLDEVNGRKRAVKFIMQQSGLYKQGQMGGIIFRISDELKKNFAFYKTARQLGDQDIEIEKLVKTGGPFDFADAEREPMIVTSKDGL